jgi:hypothetical protein
LILQLLSCAQQFSDAAAGLQIKNWQVSPLNNLDLDRLFLRVIEEFGVEERFKGASPGVELGVEPLCALNANQVNELAPSH